MGISKWVRAAANIFDPGRNARIVAASQRVEKELATRRNDFVLTETAQQLDIYSDELPAVVAETFRTLLRRALRDGGLQDREIKTLNWAAKMLNLAEPDRCRVESEAGSEAISQLLETALLNRAFDANEQDKIRRLAASLSLNADDLLRVQFRTRICDFLEADFLRLSSDFGPSQWSKLIATAERLAVDPATLLKVISPLAEKLVEHLMSQAKQLPPIRGPVWDRVHWILTNLIIRDEFRRRVLDDVSRTNYEAAIDAGNLPSVQTNDVEIRSGEIVHVECAARFQRTKQNSQGTRTFSCDGTLTITDYRLLFRSNEAGLEVSHGRVLHLLRHSNAFELTTSGKGTGTYFPAREPYFVSRIYEVAIAKANRRIVQSGMGMPDRHIPQDVRQRVFQQYGGRCAECGATEYLEYDHIIPIAKGGSNGENNIQILCRRCNAKKSSKI